jgi:hypothetical protein
MNILFSISLLFGETVYSENLDDLFKYEDTAKFARMYVNKNLQVKVKLWNFYNLGSVTWFVGEVIDNSNYAISCPIENYITTYDNLKKGDIVIVNGTISATSHAHRPKFKHVLDLRTGCSFYK